MELYVSIVLDVKNGGIDYSAIAHLIQESSLYIFYIRCGEKNDSIYKAKLKKSDDQTNIELLAFYILPNCIKSHHTEFEIDRTKLTHLNY